MRSMAGVIHDNTVMDENWQFTTYFFFSCHKKITRSRCLAWLPNPAKAAGKTVTKTDDKFPVEMHLLGIVKICLLKVSWTQHISFLGSQMPAAFTSSLFIANTHFLLMFSSVGNLEKKYIKYWCLILHIYLN